MGEVCEKPKLAKQRTFFNESKITHSMNSMNMESNGFDYQNMKTKVKLEFKIENIENNHKYQLKARFLESGYSESFTTEIVTSHINLIIFNTCYICDYFFEKR